MQRHHGHAVQRLGDFRARNDFVHCHIDPLHDGTRQFCRPRESAPARYAQVTHAQFIEGRHIGQVGQALLAHGGKRPEFPFLDPVHDDAAGRIEHHQQASRKEVLQCLRGALVGHVHEITAGAKFQHFSREMERLPDAAGAETHLAGIGLGIVDKSLEGGDAR